MSEGPSRMRPTAPPPLRPGLVARYAVTWAWGLGRFAAWRGVATALGTKTPLTRARAAVRILE
ncbi:MAG TPA: hypothetical protein PKA64_24575, partial [Myxococcota bacterium]|nr:hypothetical protein [Myxococcota bacterium]